MDQLIRIGHRVINPAAVSMAWEADGAVMVFLSGVPNPLRFVGGEAALLWRALARLATPVETLAGPMLREG